MLILVGAALFLLLVGALTPPWPRGLYAARDGRRGRRRRRAGDGAVGRHHRRGPVDARRRRAGVRHVRPVRHDHDLRRGRARRPRRPTTTCAARASTGPRSTPCSSSPPTGGVVMASANDLIVLFIGLETLSLGVLRPRRQLPPQGRQRRERHQVLRARRLLVGVPALRHRPRLRRHRLDEHLRDGRRDVRRPSPSSATTPSCSPASRCCSSGSASRSPRCRSTCGRPTSTRARRRR